MWDTLAEPWRACLSGAWESYCEGSVPIGAAITDEQGRIVAVGRNRAASPPAGEAGQVTGGTLAHAEVNALLRLAAAAVDVRACELYSTVEPCPLCIGAICMAGIKVVRFAAADAWAGSTNLLQASPYLVRKAIRAMPPDNTRLETLVKMIQVDALIRGGHPRWPEVVDTWARRDPANTALGRRLLESGELQRLRQEGTSTEAMVARLDRLIDEWAATVEGAGAQSPEAITILRARETDLPWLAAEWGEKAARHLHFGDDLTVMALAGERPAGLLSAYARDLPPPLSPAGETYIDFLEVRPEFRRRGIASRMVDLSLEHARSRGHHQVRTWSSEDKLEALPFWLSLGFGLHPASTFPRAAGGREVRGFFATRPVGGLARER